MFFGAPARSLDDIARLRRARFDFGEIAIANAGARRMWWESGVITVALASFSSWRMGLLKAIPMTPVSLESLYSESWPSILQNHLNKSGHLTKDIESI